MISIVLSVILIFTAVWIGSSVYSSLTKEDKRNLASVVFKAVLCLLVVVCILFTIVVLF